ncbi:YqaJ viral recombinase family protein [Listeria monocytogenes]|nr:YqaJ viral recombinase family protein [Listeria monocytogenes]EGR8601433.1 YqaJ viral recombinase family protein [Listeria monocytogenes]EGR8634530.1 YqaJ viral recombinase family protein [Listeria monocytogenes]EGR8666904.1 YqaJ viral recombinase family protein [Listeria monocytogenes]EGR8669783.1 YqaJ viral recombinase family protein [Listeria monocytogenes]
MTAPADTGSILIELPDLEQGTDEWHDQRRGIITASVVGKLITSKTLKAAANPESRSLTAHLVAERITGWTDPTYISDDMLRGMADEPRARDKYAEHFNVPVRQVGFMIRETRGVKLGYSPDGLVGDDGLIEVKSRLQKKQVETVLSGEPPAENMAQLQCGLFVSGREWIDYISYSGGMHLWVTRVFPDQRWFDAIEAAVQGFEKSAAEMIRLYEQSVVGFPMTERVFTEMEFD